MIFDKKSFVSGFAVATFAAFGCATAAFNWPYYAPSMPDSCYDQGILLGKLGNDGWSDLPMSACKPDPTPSPSPGPSPIAPVKLKCMIVRIDDFYSIKADDEKCHQDLQDCQAGPKPQ